MKFNRFLKDKAIFIALNVGISAFSAFLLYLIYDDLLISLFVACSCAFGFTASLIIEFITKNKYYQILYHSMEKLDKKTLLSDIMPSADFYEGSILYDILKIQNKAMNDEIAKHSKAFSEYREYIELWVHEIKTPIAGAKLICENSGNTSFLESLQKIDKLVEQALFYCRSNHVEKDFLINELVLRELINACLRKNSRFLIDAKVSVEIGKLDISVFTDSKWVEFILQQIIDNAVKYKCHKLKFYAKYGDNNISLFVVDDGIGIPSQDVNRVFEKGFTGENGRLYAKSTGIGLYLCKKLCQKLGLSISLTSEKNKGTAIEIVFPKNSNLTKM